MKNVRFEIQKMIDGTWRKFTLEEFSGKTVAEVFESYIGKEILVKMEYRLDKNFKCYLCGTDELVTKVQDAMKRKREDAFVIPMEKGLKRLRERGSLVLDVVCPNVVSDIFPDGTIEVIKSVD